MTVAAFKPQTPAMAVTPESTFESVINTGCTYSMSAPHIVEVSGQTRVSVIRYDRQIL